MAEPPLAASILLSASVGTLAAGQPVDLVPPASARRDTFVNPVCERGADPWLLRWNGAYYYCRSRKGSIRVSRSERLHEICADAGVAVCTPPPRTSWSRDLWAPELHHLDGRFYIYVAADDGRNRSHRMYVLEGDARDPLKPFTLKGRIADPSDRWAIDGTVLTLEDGRRYFVWSGWEGERNVAQSLYIAPMSNPWTISGARVRISTPERPWETRSRPLVNEGPSVLRSPQGRVFLVYSAGGSWTDDYCLGLLALVGSDPMLPSSWLKRPQPAFSRSSRVFGPGHASFVTSPDGSEHWIVYHAARYRGAGWDRNVRMQRFGWSADGTPDFGVPLAPGVQQPLPSGTLPAASAGVPVGARLPGLVPRAALRPAGAGPG